MLKRFIYNLWAVQAVVLELMDNLKDVRTMGLADLMVVIN